MSFNILFLDEFAFVPNHIAEAFFASVYPTITSGKSTKVIIVSTPHGMNHFYRMWTDAEKVEMNMYQLMFTGQRYLVGILSGKNRPSRTHQNNNSRLSLSVSSLDRLTL